MDSRRVGYFELISTYFAAIYYNHLYDKTIEAVKKSSNIGINLANEYRSAIRGYHEAVTTDEKYYSGTIKDLWNAEFKTRSPISLPEFVDIVVKLFIPENVHDQLTNDSLRDRWMANIVHKMVAGFSTRINNLFVERIIDVKQRDIRLQHEIQDAFNDVLYQIMDEIHHKITKSTVKTSSAVPREQFEKMIELVKLAKNTKDYLEKELQRTKEYLHNAEKEIEKLKKQNAELLKENEKIRRSKNSVKFVEPPKQNDYPAGENESINQSKQRTPNKVSPPAEPPKQNDYSAGENEKIRQMKKPPAESSKSKQLPAEPVSNLIDEDEDDDDEETQIKKIMSARKNRQVKQ